MAMVNDRETIVDPSPEPTAPCADAEELSTWRLFWTLDAELEAARLTAALRGEDT